MSDCDNQNTFDVISPLEFDPEMVNVSNIMSGTFSNMVEVMYNYGSNTDRLRIITPWVETISSVEEHTHDIGSKYILISLKNMSSSSKITHR